jgi:hypothetical protein
LDPNAKVIGKITIKVAVCSLRRQVFSVQITVEFANAYACKALSID